MKTTKIKVVTGTSILNICKESSVTDDNTFCFSPGDIVSLVSVRASIWNPYYDGSKFLVIYPQMRGEAPSPNVRKSVFLVSSISSSRFYDLDVYFNNTRRRITHYDLWDMNS